ncbi:hypothetical protein [Streptomyces pacificus]|uniref:Uncharacterized protein n=1 Tax=Streptomyces pacificus TaxID=2705029 RepID=A0A6A0AY87_9ACTN|nr:hypothetical protein [Streptomyces pacificus]GFH37919.1 hypothetical protein SCWH03_41590 [Streptomyces pacificus]
MTNDSTAAHFQLRKVDCDADEAALRGVDVIDGESNCNGLYLAYQEEGVFGVTTPGGGRSEQQHRGEPLVAAMAHTT